PYLERGAGRVRAGRLALVLDVSASMQAREAGTTRFDAARRRARALLDGLAAGNQAMLITAADRAHVVSGWTADQAKVREQLDALVPLDTATRLGAALELALGEAQARAPALLRAPPRPGVVTIRLVVDDALAVDNRAFAWIAPATPLDLLVVTDAREAAVAFEAIGHAVADSRVHVVNRARYEEEPLAGYRAAVFDGFVPASAMNALYVAPPPGNAVCPTDGMADAAAVVDWEPEHPALSGFEGLQALRLGPVRRLATPAWGVSIVRAAARGGDFPLLVAGEQRGRRVACLASGLGPSVQSDIGRDGNRTWAARMPFASPPAIPGRHEIDWWLYAVAAAFLGVEWLVWLATEAR